MRLAWLGRNTSRRPATPPRGVCRAPPSDARSASRRRTAARSALLKHGEGRARPRLRFGLVASLWVATTLKGRLPSRPLHPTTAAAMDRGPSGCQLLRGMRRRKRSFRREAAQIAEQSSARAKRSGPKAPRAGMAHEPVQAGRLRRNESGKRSVCPRTAALRRAPDAAECLFDRAQRKFGPMPANVQPAAKPPSAPAMNGPAAFHSAFRSAAQARAQPCAARR